MDERARALSLNADSGARRVLLPMDSMLGPNSPMSSRNFHGFDEDFWHKIQRAADGLETLTSEDAKRIITILRDGGDQDTESHIVSLIMSRLKASKDIMDEGFLRYLSENYNKLMPPISEETPEDHTLQSDNGGHQSMDEGDPGTTSVCT